MCDCRLQVVLRYFYILSWNLSGWLWRLWLFSVWLLLLGESSRFDVSLFTFFEKKTAHRCDCFPYKETDWEKKMNCRAWLHAWKICRRWSFLWTKNSRSTWRLRVIVELWNEMKRKEKEKKVLNAPSTCTSHSTTSEHNSEQKKIRGTCMTVCLP